MIARFYVGCFSATRWLQDGPRAIQDTFFRPQEPPRALQEVFERLSEGVCVQDTIRTPFWTIFWTRFGSPGTLKTKEFLETFINNQGFTIFSLDRFRTPILDPRGLRFGSLLIPKVAETCLEMRFGLPQSASRLLFFGSTSQEKQSSKKGSDFDDFQASRDEPPPAARTLRESGFCGLQPVSYCKYQHSRL